MSYFEVWREKNCVKFYRTNFKTSFWWEYFLNIILLNFLKKNWISNFYLFNRPGLLVLYSSNALAISIWTQPFSFFAFFVMSVFTLFSLCCKNCTTVWQQISELFALILSKTFSRWVIYLPENKLGYLFESNIFTIKALAKSELLNCIFPSLSNNTK